MRRRPLLMLRMLLMGALPVIAAGCAADPTEGYSTASTFPTQISTVAVPIFENDTFVRDVEFELTDALIKEIHARTPYRVIDQARAETILVGRIRDVDLERLSKSRLTGLSQEVIVSVTIDFVWKDLRTDVPLLERRAFTAHGLFVPSRPSSEPIELGRFEAVQTLARDVVGEMRSSW